MSQKLFLEQDGPVLKTLELEDGKVRASLHQNCEDGLALNSKQQNNFNPASITDPDVWSIPLARIPYVIFQQMVSENPDLVSKDPEIKQKAWMKAIAARDDIRTVPKNYVPSGKKIHA